MKRLLSRWRLAACVLFALCVLAFLMFVLDAEMRAHSFESKYLLLQDGMTEEQIVAILGPWGEKGDMDGVVGGTGGQACAWLSENGDYISVELHFVKGTQSQRRVLTKKYFREGWPWWKVRLSKLGVRF